MTTLKIGSNVTVKHGNGIIVGKDLPDSIAWRWIVEIIEPNDNFTESFESMYPEKKLCYFNKEILATMENDNET